MARSFAIERRHRAALESAHDAVAKAELQLHAAREVARAKVADLELRLQENTAALEESQTDRATKASELEALKKEVAQLRKGLEEAEERCYDRGFEEAGDEYQKQVDQVRALEYANGVRFGFEAAHKELLVRSGILPNTPAFVVPEPLPEWLVHPWNQPASSESDTEGLFAETEVPSSTDPSGVEASSSQQVAPPNVQPPPSAPLTAQAEDSPNAPGV